MSDKRIIELESISDVPADAYLVIDSVSGDTRKIKPIKIGATYEIEDGDHSFTLVGSNGYSHTVDIPYDSVSMTQAEYNALTPAQKADGTARFITDAESDVESELWSKVGRQTLDTDSQVLSNAVNELVDKTDNTNEVVADNTDAISELNSSLSSKIGGKYISTGETLSITFSIYNSVAIIYGIVNATNYIMYLFGNGYLVPIKTINNVNVSLSSDYKTISITNNISTSTLWVGVLNTFNVDMTIN